MDCLAFGAGLKDLARAGRPPVVLIDCLRYLSLKGGLTEPALFSGERVERKKLALLKGMYEAGRRPLRAKAAKHSPQTVAELLLMWLSLQPESLFPAEFMSGLIASQAGGAPMACRVAAIRGYLKQTEPFIVEALFPLFEFLHHWLLNVRDREGAVQGLGRLFAPAVFGPARSHALPEGEAGLLEDTTELMVLQYRPLFTQPHNLNRYEQDSQRAAAAAAGQHSPDPGCAAAMASAAATAAAGLPSPGTSPPSPSTGVMLQAAPLLTPLRVGQLSVVDPAAGARSPFSIADDRSPLPSDLSSPCRSAELVALWDAEHAELFAADPELHSALSMMLESTVSCGLGLAEGSEAAAAAAAAAAASAATDDAGTAKAIALASAGGDGACSPTAVLLAGAEQASDGSGSDGETCCADAAPAALRSGSPQVISLRAGGCSSVASPFAAPVASRFPA